MVIKLDKVDIEMNFMEPEKLEDHLEGFKGLAYNYVSKGIDPVYVLTRIFYVRLAVVLIKKVMYWSFLKILIAYNSLLFYDSKVFDYDMQVLAEL